MNNNPFHACLLGLLLCSASMPALAQGNGDNGEIAEIVVTAQRRAQKLQDVPVTVNAISGTDALAAGITGTSTLQTAVPSLTMQRSANAALPFIRGIGSSIGDANAEGSVAVYVDGVYQPANFGNIFEFNNIERIEVLKGPQGTLFGRNSTGGVIQVVTRDPTHAPQADFSFGYANYQKVSATGYASAGLTEDIAFNVAVMYQNQDKGWGRNLTTGGRTEGLNDFGIRGKLLITPGDATEIRFAADYIEAHGQGITGQPPPGGAATVDGRGYPGRYNVWSNHTDTSDIDSHSLSLRIDHDFGPLQVASITAYRKSKGLWTFDIDESAVPLLEGNINQRAKMVTQEVHLLSPSHSVFQWLVGGYFFDYRAGHTPLSVRGLAFAPLPGLDFYGFTKTRSFSAFAQGTYPLAENTNLTLGFRYSWDNIRSRSATTIGDTDIIIDPANGAPVFRRLKYEKPTWRVSLDHKFAPDFMGYVSYNRGIKSGSFTTGTMASLNLAYQPEQLDAFEAGFKSEFLDRRVRLNGAIFYYDFKNIQFQKIVSGSSLIFNGPSARSYGAELELEARPIENLTINLNGGWLHTRIGDFPGAPNTRLLPNGLADGGDPNFNARGNDLPFAPKFTGGAGFNYKIPTESGTFNLAANVYYNDGSFSEIDNRLRVDNYVLANASIGWTDASEALSLTLWGRNLGNEYYYSQLTSQAGGVDVASPAQPRTYGFTIGYKFD